MTASLYVSYHRIYREASLTPHRTSAPVRIATPRAVLGWVGAPALFPTSSPHLPAPPRASPASNGLGPAPGGRDMPAAVMIGAWEWECTWMPCEWLTDAGMVGFNAQVALP